MNAHSDALRRRRTSVGRVLIHNNLPTLAKDKAVMASSRSVKLCALVAPQGPPLLHFSAQLELFLSLKHPETPCFRGRNVSG